MRVEADESSTGRSLIVNADDFGQSPGINSGILRAHESGIVTSTSMMVRWPAARDAARDIDHLNTLSVGLHVDLGEWEHDGADWTARYVIVPLENVTAVRTEVRRQLESFCNLLGRMPTHLDSHQHTHLREPVRTVVWEVAQEIGVPLRHVAADIQYCGQFYGQTADGEALPERLTRESLRSILANLEAGVTELVCHPASELDFYSSYAAERLRELEVLCDPALPKLLEELGIRLVSFAEIGKSRDLPTNTERTFASKDSTLPSGGKECH